MSGSHTGLHAPRSCALIGPYGSGKTTLLEALMDMAGVKLRHAGDKNTPEPGTEARLFNCAYLGDDWALLDCPGGIEFQAEAAAALCVADMAVVVAEPDPARAMALRPALAALEAAGVPFVLFINKADQLSVPAATLMAALQAETATRLVARELPILEQGRMVGYVDLVSERAYRYRERQASERVALPAAVAAEEQSAHDALVDMLADRDDALLEKVIGGETVSAADLFAHVRHDVGEGAIAEVMFGSGLHGNGVARLWKALRHDAPEASVTAARHGVAPEGGALAQVFKVSYAGQAGKLCYARIWRGTLRDGASAGQMRVGGIFAFPGPDAQKRPEARAGELVALGRLEGAVAGTVFGEAPGSLGFPAPPPAVYALAITVPDHKDDVRLSTALGRLLEEDPALSLTRDGETGETRLEGQGEAHLARAVERLRKGWGLNVTCAGPKLRLKETIRAAVHEHARLKRQTGGHGQFADVKLEVAPRARGEGFLFIDRVTGGAVPRQYIPAVAAAAEEAMAKGPFGYPVVDVAVTLHDGGFHSVDSSDMAFRTATRSGIAEALSKAGPVLLEPVHRVRVSAPAIYTAAVQRLLSGKHGQILGYEAKPGWPGWDETLALLPEAELHRMILDLRAQTAGLGAFVHEFDHLAEAAAHLAERVARQAAQ
ncbi:elongation factor G [Acidocella sp.]|uniref:elongation factor G n=1 Tax=Acidocella sp. TaxID=50710 RepID=UPI00263443B9|nr:elongation factor G [Acidocella sp.]